jgi:hypothetical protein
MRFCWHPKRCQLNIYRSETFLNLKLWWRNNTYIVWYPVQFLCIAVFEIITKASDRGRIVILCVHFITCWLCCRCWSRLRSGYWVLFMRFQGCNVLPVVTTYHCNIASCVFRCYLHSMYTKCLIYQYLQTLLRIIYRCSVGIGIYLEWKHPFTDICPLSVFRDCLNCTKLTGRWKCIRLLGLYNRCGQSLTLQLCEVERKFYSKG